MVIIRGLTLTLLCPGGARAVWMPAGRGLWCFASGGSGLRGVFLFLWARLAGAGADPSTNAPPGRGSGKTDVLNNIYINI